MFGLSWDQIILILLAALFLLGPERIPTAIKWVMDSLRKVRTMAAGAQDEFRSQMGSEMDELRKQISELQSLKELKELRDLRDLDPRRMIGKNLLGDEFSGGVKGFLGLDGASAEASARRATESAVAGETPVAEAGSGGAAASTPASPSTIPTASPTAPAASSGSAASSEPAASSDGTQTSDTASSGASASGASAWADADFT